MRIRGVVSLILGIALVSIIMPMIDALAQQSETRNVEQKIDDLSNELFWISVGVIIAALSAIGTISFDIYDRYKEKKTQNLELVRSYGQQLADLSDKEPKLNNKKDCENYAIEYLDLMDQIAYLYDRHSISHTVAEYFDNNLAYAKTLLIWLNEKWYKISNKREKINTFEMKLYEEDESGKNKTTPVAFEFEITWTHLIKWLDDKQVTPFDAEELPEAMQNYCTLPAEGITEFLEVIRSYGKQLTELLDKERNLNTNLDFELYAMSYLDLMDQIAFLYKKKSIPEDVAEYFDNYFSYAKALLIWIQDKTGILIDEKRSKIEIRLYDDKKTAIPQEIRDEWIDLVTWCENRKIDASDIEQLPETMQKYRVKH